MVPKVLGIAFAFAGAAFMVFYGQVPHSLCEALGVFGTGLFEKIGVFPFHLPKKWRRYHHRLVLVHMRII